MIPSPAHLLLRSDYSREMLQCIITIDTPAYTIRGCFDSNNNSRILARLTSSVLVPLQMTVIPNLPYTAYNARSVGHPIYIPLWRGRPLAVRIHCYLVATSLDVFR
jgi:hypothetical protein